MKAAAAKLAAAIKDGRPLPAVCCPDCGGDLFEVLVAALEGGAAAAIDQAQANMAALRRLQAARREALTRSGR
ncbi:MAG: hypothetical protein OXG39_09960 [Chloroflexi bacterium]|nr:hypothetical protein [Chloroflexota bacterium]